MIEDIKTNIEMEYLRNQVENLKIYPEFAFFTLMSEREYLNDRINLVGSLIREHKEQLSELSKRREVIEKELARIKKTLLYRTSKFLLPLLSFLGLLFKKFRDYFQYFQRAKDLDVNLSNIKIIIEEKEEYLRKLIHLESYLKDKLSNISKHEEEIRREERKHLVNLLKSWGVEADKLRERVERLLDCAKKPRTDIDKELVSACEREKNFYKLVEEGAEILCKKCQNHFDLIIHSEDLFKRIRDIGKSLERAESMLKTYVTVVSYPNMPEAFYTVAERAQKELYIISPYTSEESLEKVLEHVKPGVSVKIIVKREGDYVKARKVAEKRKKVEVKLGSKVHCKFLVNEEELLISSANISEQGFEKWFEIGIVTNDPNVVNKAREFFLALWNGKYYKENYYGGDKISINTFTQTTFISSASNLPPILFDLIKSAKESIVIISPYWTYGATKELIEYASEDIKIDAIIRIDKQDLARGLTEPEAVELLKRYGDVWDYRNLHAKALIVDDRFAIISSLNITDEGFKQNYEAGVLTQNPIVIDRLKAITEKLKVKRVSDEELKEEYKRSRPQVLKLRSEPSLIEVKAMEEKITSYPPHAGLDLKLPKKRREISKTKKKGEESEFLGEKAQIIMNEIVEYVMNKGVVDKGEVVEYIIEKYGEKRRKVHRFILSLCREGKKGKVRFKLRLDTNNKLIFEDLSNV